MKKITVKIKETCATKEPVMRRLIQDIQQFCIDGTINMTRFKMRNITFKIEDRFEEKLQEFTEFENIQQTDC